MLVKYFWQAERIDWLSYLTASALVTTAIILAARQILRRCERSRDQRKNVFFRQAIVLLAGVNTAFLSIDLVSFTSHASQQPKDRIEAILKPWAPYSFELSHHVNPVVTLLASLSPAGTSDLTGEIPLYALTPLGGIKPADFPEIESEDRRNIILITIESLRSDAILMKHQGQQVMPHVAELARTGYFFPNCYANSTHSDYSDPSILSSLYPLRRTRQHFYRREDPWPKVLVYDLLKQFGYATAMFSSQNEAWSNMHLFYESPHLDVFFDSRAYEGPTHDEQGFFRSWMSQTNLAGKLDDAVTTKRALEWIDSQHANSNPFFIALNFQTSHFPYHRPDGEKGPFTPSKIDFRTSALSYDEGRAAVFRNAYFNALHYVDMHIGRIVSHLNDSGQRDDTLIVITGDHGEAFYENGVVGHGVWPLETVIRTGLVMNCSALVSRGVDAYLAQAIDIVPTAVGLIGCPPHPAFQGINLLGSDRPPLEERVIFVHCCNPLTGVDCMLSGTGWKYAFNLRSNTATLQFRPSDLTYAPNDVAKEHQLADALHEYLNAWRDRQLIYYGRSKYFLWFWPPAEPEIAPSTLQLLKQRSNKKERG